MVLPITSGGSFARTAGFAVTLAGAGTRTTGVVRCDRPRALDLRALGGKKLECVPTAIMDDVLAPIFEGVAEEISNRRSSDDLDRATVRSLIERLCYNPG